jgi:hypothetical protein
VPVKSAVWRQTGNMIGRRDSIWQILSGQATRIESLAGVVLVGEMHHAPRPETLKYGLERFSVRCHLIHYPESQLRRGYAGDEVVSLKLPQLLSKNFGRYSRHGPPKLTKSESSAAQALENHWLSPAF